MEVDVAEVGALEGREVAWLLLRDECLHPLICHLLALPIGRDKLIVHEIQEGQSWETACDEHVGCTCDG